MVNWILFFFMLAVTAGLTGFGLYEMDDTHIAKLLFHFSILLAIILLAIDTDRDLRKLSSSHK